MKTHTLLAVIFLALSLNSLEAQTLNSSTGSSSTNFVTIINQVGQQGLNLFRAVLFVFLMIYAVLLGVAVAFGQAGSPEITSFVLGTIIAAGAQLIGAIYLAILSQT